MKKAVICSKCSASFIPFRRDFKCPNCGEPTSDFFDLIPSLVNLMECNKEKYGKYRPNDWEVNSFSENIQRYTSEIFDIIDEKGFNDPEDFIKYYFNRARKDGKEKYICNHFEDIALAIAIEMRKRLEERQIKKLKKAKTGESIAFDKAYGVVVDGKDTGRRFIRKEDADKYLKQQSQQNKK